MIIPLPSMTGFTYQIDTYIPIDTLTDTYILMNTLKTQKYIKKNPQNVLKTQILYQKNLNSEITVRQRLKVWLFSQSTCSQAQFLGSI